MAVTSAEFRVRSAEWRKIVCYFVFSLMLLAWPLISSAQILPSPPRTPNPEPRTPLFWAQGITQIPQLDTYQQTGLNTVVVRLTWPPTPDGSLAPSDLAPQRSFALAAASRGLNVIYQLPAGPFGMERQLRMTADSDAYFTVWTMWVQAAVQALRDTPNLVGWMLPDDPRALPYFEDLGFGRWMATNYAHVGIVNRQWNSQFNDFQAVTITAAQLLVDGWRGPQGITDGMTGSELQKHLSQTNLRAGSEHWTFHPASLAIANYKWWSYRALLARWAAVVKGADAKATVFSGRLPDYAQLLSLPPNVDFAVPDIRPDNAEVDIATHNPQAVDIARRGGHFRVLPVLTTAGPIPPEMLPNLIPEWADSALAHGASGLVFSSWPALAVNEPLRAAVESTLGQMKVAPRAELWHQKPIATTAIILTPLADGYTRPGAFPGQDRGLYGFGENMVAGEPNNLVYALRWGTLFGSVDYLSPDDVEADANLNRYNTILMPQALSVSGAMEAALNAYVHNGGVLVADLGLGAMQAESQAASVPPSLANLFGIVPQMKMRALSFNLELLAPHPLLPTWSSSGGGANSAGLARRGVTLTGGKGPRGVAFAGPVGFPVAVSSTLENTIPVALASQVPQQFGPNQFSPTKLERSVLTVHRAGRGYALFAPFAMWTMWLPGQSGFDAFHGDLFARGAAVAQGSSSLVPAPSNSQTMIYPETINLPNGVLLLNHLAPTTPPPQAQTQTSAIVVPSLSPPSGRAPTPPSTPEAIPTAPTPPPNSLYSMVQTMGMGNFLWRGGLCVFPAQGQSLFLAGQRAAPIAQPNAEESQPHSISLHALVKPYDMTAFTLIAARAENLAGGPLSAYVTSWTPRDAKFYLWPNSTAVVPAGEDLGVLVTNASPVRLTLYDSAKGYRIRPNSRHRVQFADKSGEGANPALAVVQADLSGKLIIEATGAANYFEISPLDAD